MKDTLGSQGVQVLLKTHERKKKKKKTKKAEDGKSTENGETLKNYDSK